MLGPFIFGEGKGHLPQRAAAIASFHGAELFNYTEPGCSCGHGCRRGCPERRRHWFGAVNLGEPHNGKTARAVLDALEAAGIHV